MMYAGLRAAKAEQVTSTVRMTGTFDSNQRAIWHDIDNRSRRYRIDSATGAMSDLYRQSHGSLEDYTRALVPVEGQLGAVFAVGGKVVGAECFGRSDTLHKVFPKLLQSYALDALDTPSVSATPKAASKQSATRFLQSVARAAVEARASVGEGRDLRVESRTVTGLALALDEQLLHLSAFRRSKGAGAAPAAGAGWG
jgi:hypothetical protein